MRSISALSVCFPTRDRVYAFSFVTPCNTTVLFLASVSPPVRVFAPSLFPVLACFLNLHSPVTHDQHTMWVSSSPPGPLFLLCHGGDWGTRVGRFVQPLRVADTSSDLVFGSQAPDLACTFFRPPLAMSTTTAPRQPVLPTHSLSGPVKVRPAEEYRDLFGPPKFC